MKNALSSNQQMSLSSDNNNSSQGDQFFSFDSGHMCLVEPLLSSEEIISYRRKVGMSQRQFAREFGIPLGTLRRWEQGQNRPRLAASVQRLISSLLGQRKKAVFE